MPIARHQAMLIYYAHVPKCAGTAIEEYLQQRFGDLAFMDRRHFKRPYEPVWTATSPQHVSLKALSRLFPADFFDHSFTVVRHPVARIVSAYHFHRDVEGTVPTTVGLSEWLSALPEELEERPFAHDNHLRPMVEMVPDEAKVFHLEHGIDAIVPWLDAICGSEDGPRSIKQVNPGKAKKWRNGRRLDPEIPTETDRRVIAEVYAEDFKRFGYSLESDRPVHAGAATRARSYRPKGRSGVAGAMGRLQSRLTRLLRT